MDTTWKNISGLDLKYVRNNFAARRNWWWHLSHKPQQIENQYRQFLYLLAVHPDKTLVPWSADLNDFWHQHIVDTTKYARDCDAIAGRLLNHNPHIAEGSGAHARAFAETRKLYLASFGETARKRRCAAGEADFGSDTTTVFSDGSSTAHGHHGSHHGGGHYGAGHHGSGHGAGSHGSSDHGGGGHAGHSGGGHSSCGGHSGCGGHGH